MTVFFLCGGGSCDGFIFGDEVVVMVLFWDVRWLLGFSILWWGGCGGFLLFGGGGCDGFPFLGVVAVMVYFWGAGGCGGFLFLGRRWL